MEDFENIPRDDDSSKKVGLLEENIKKNRYQNILPYDISRVKLVQKRNIPQSTYINASYINGYLYIYFLFENSNYTVIHIQFHSDINLRLLKTCIVIYVKCKNKIVYLRLDNLG